MTIYEIVCKGKITSKGHHSPFMLLWVNYVVQEGITYQCVEANMLYQKPRSENLAKFLFYRLTTLFISVVEIRVPPSLGAGVP